jgi:3-phosphoglycerate kinase
MDPWASFFKIKPFDEETKDMVETLADLTTKGCVTVVVGGGDSMAALEAFGKTQAVSPLCIHSLVAVPLY